jgi:hypothetical protein
MNDTSSDEEEMMFTLPLLLEAEEKENIYDKKTVGS